MKSRPNRFHARAAFASAISLTALLSMQGELSAAGPAPLNLRSTAPFAILAASEITTTGDGTINGDVGLSPGSGADIHLTPGQVNGTIYATNGTGHPSFVIAPALLDTAKDDLTTVFNEAKDLVPVPVGSFLNPGAGNVGGMNLPPGLYKFESAALISGSDLTLTGSSEDVWVFQIGTQLTVANGMQVILAGGAKPWNVFWQVGTSAVLGTTVAFKGTILADQSITMNTGSILDGRALASNGMVTYNGTGGSLPVPEPPRFTSISREANGAVNLALETTPDFQITLETSTTLIPGSWSIIQQATPASSPWHHTHAAGQAIGPKRFYRASLAPK